MFSINRVAVVVRKDLLTIKNDKTTVVTICIFPLIFCVVFPLILLIGGADNVLTSSLSGLTEFTRHLSINIVPSNLARGSESLYAVLMYFFIPLFLLIPIMISNVIASSSFVGEKENKTMEGLLYTPLTNAELVMGKILASAIPTIIITWLSMMIYGLVIDTIGANVFNQIVFPNLNWILVMFVLDPIIIFLSIALVVFVSQRVKTSKSAQSVAIILILPILGGVISQAGGAFLFGPVVVLVVSVLLLILDLASFLVISKYFNREKYLLNI